MTMDEIAGILLLGGGFCFFTGINYSIIYRAKVKHEDMPSLTPFLGGICGAILMLALNGIHHPLRVLLPLLIDPGSIPLVLEFIVLIIMEQIKR